MKILLVSSSDNHGSYEYAYRMAKALLAAGHEVGMMVKKKTQTDSFVIEVPRERVTIAARIKWKLFGDTTAIKTDPTYFFLHPDEAKPSASEEMVMRYLPFNPDLVLVGMSDGFINTKTIATIAQTTGA